MVKQTVSVQLAGAVWAAGGVVRNLALAVRAGTGRSRFFRRFAHPVDLFDNDENCQCNQQEINDRVDEGTVGDDSRASLFGFCQVRKLLIAQIDIQVAKIHSADQFS